MSLLFQNRVIINKQSIVDINLPDYIYVFCTTELTASGTLLYIRRHLLYKLNKDVSIYKLCELKSTLIKISNLKKTNIVKGCIYRY